MIANRLMVAVVAAMAMSGVVYGQSFPTKPIRFIVSAPAGGGNDFLARIVGQKLSELLGVQVVVDNRSGAGGNIAAEAAAHANPDGCTLFLFNSQTAIAPSIYRQLPFDPIKDFSPITWMVSSPFLLVVNQDTAARTIGELIALAKARPGALTYASGGIGSSTHLVGELFGLRAGINIVHVPYKGAAPAFVDLIGGQVTMYFASVPAANPYLKTGRIRALAMTGARRVKLLPDLPTMAEAGVRDYEAFVSYGIVTAARTPPDAIRKLNTAFVNILSQPVVRERLEGEGTDVIASTPSDYARQIKHEVAMWAQLVKTSGARAE